METVAQDEIAKPDWSKWRLMVEADLQNAVALSCDIDPEALKRGIKGELLDEFFRRSDIARNHKHAGSLRFVIRSSPFGNIAMVGLLDFARWAESLGLPLPGEFPRPPFEEPKLASRWPWGMHDTRLLRELAAAAQHHWTGYDPASPATAPNSEEVQRWLTARGVASKRVAEVMAQILRADDLKSGPHVNP